MKTSSYILTLLAVPVLTYGAEFNADYPISVIDGLSEVVYWAVPLAIAIGLLLFIWGLVLFLTKSGDETALEEGKRRMVWGIVTLFVIVSVWGLVALVGQITGVADGGSVNAPDTDF